MTIWHWLSTSRYTRSLEAEVERLRSDRDEARRHVWALMNSLVTTTGAPLPQEILKLAERKTGAPAPAGPGQQRGKKSWHQRAMALEIESVRRARDLAAGGAEPEQAKVAHEMQSGICGAQQKGEPR
jgi:hypothetical protein